MIELRPLGQAPAIQKLLDIQPKFDFGVHKVALLVIKYIIMSGLQVSQAGPNTMDGDVQRIARRIRCRVGPKKIHENLTVNPPSVIDRQIREDLFFPAAAPMIQRPAI